jgi:hypothetical protein
MSNAPCPAPNADAPLEGESTPWSRFLYRTFIEFNPLYLLSAALVLAGTFLISRGLGTRESLASMLGISCIGEIYSFALLGGAALLTRIGPRRPAVMLALLFLLYQWDLTFHTERCAYLETAGVWSTLAWVASFLAKLYALGWALRVRLARNLVVAAIVGAIGLAVFPHVISDLGPRNTGALIAIWGFALSALYRPDAVQSLDALTPWGHTVLRRTTHAAWVLSGTLLGVHVLFWAKDHDIALSYVLPIAPLFFVRRTQSEGRAWTLVVATLAFIGLTAPSLFSLTSLLAGAALCLRVLSPAFVQRDPATPLHRVPEHAYRASSAEPHDVYAAKPSTTTAIIGAAERARSFAGAICALYLSVWTLRWAGGPLPEHLLWLDLALTVALIFATWRLRVRAPLVALAACYGHLVVQKDLIPWPSSATEWGATAIALGFALLAGSLAVSYRFRVPRSVTLDERSQPSPR